ncbi:MAG: DUF4390 domain-containing protein [Pseudomonadota bacterium]|nr:DUF4390 domain-containing protein [Pseudomonadota bacterium]
MNDLKINCKRIISKFFFAVAFSLFFIFFQTPSYAEDGFFEVNLAELREINNTWLLDGRVALDLSSEAVEALRSGMMLSIQMQFEITRQRMFWTDEKVKTSIRDFELRYMTLNQRYLVRNTITGETQNFATLSSALRSMGRIRDWQVIPEGIVKKDQQYNCGLRAVLNQDRLPGPIRLLAFWRGGFIIESDWYQWKLR